MTTVSNLGFPRIGDRRQLKAALEAYWSGDTPRQALLDAAAELRRNHWRLQKQAGIEHIPSNDFSLYDHVLDTACLVGAVPERFAPRGAGGPVDLDTYFAMARGVTGDRGAPALEMTKWFDTNYHYLVPELAADQGFRLAGTKPVDEFIEAREGGIHTRPVLLGPVSFLLLSKTQGEPFDRLGLLDRLLPVYAALLQRLAAAGADWVQVDEPFLAMDLDGAQRGAFRSAYGHLSRAAPSLKLLVASYFAGLGDNLDLAAGLPVQALHIDLVRDPDELGRVLDKLPGAMALSLGVVDGRNVWKADLERAAALVERAAGALGEGRVIVAPSCSLLHVPVDLDAEPGLDELRPWLAFAKQKLGELATIALAAGGGRARVAAALEENRRAMESRRTSRVIHRPAVKERVRQVSEAMLRRKSPYPERRVAQEEHLGLPLLPTTTIGSFPQTAEVRRQRAAFRKGDLDRDDYDVFLREETERCVRFQEEIGLDVLVHGEFERTDMVEYFGEQMDGFTATRHGWVQSYGSRCVKPPIIFGDLQRKRPMTVGWARYAQSLTDRPMKGMLTAPVTILEWSFVRDDQPRSETCKQIALAIRDEVRDLEAAGIDVIQIDEPALREGLPLRKAERPAYLAWAVACFQLAASGVRDRTQIHTHMCYADFDDILGAIAELDADVISLEASRSGMELLGVFRERGYPTEVGPGVWDIHSPRVPPTEEMAALIGKAAEVVPPERLWVNPDCGLKTRKWEEVEPALRHMVEAARRVREELAAAGR